MPNTRTVLTRDLEDAARTEHRMFETAWAQPGGYDPDSILAHQHQAALREWDTAVQRLLADGASYEDVARAAGLTPEGIRRISERHAEPSDRPLSPLED